MTIYFSVLHRRTLNHVKVLQHKIEYYDRRFNENLENMEKKIGSDAKVVDEIGKEFKMFQAKFLEFDRKVERLTVSLSA